MPRMQQRRDTAANWTSANPTLAAGEIGVETDTSKFKVGNGSTVWSSLAYVGIVSSVAGRVGVVTLTASDVSNTVSTKSQVSADQNNYSLGTGDVFRISSDAARSFTGFVATSDGDARLLVNVGSFDITLKHQSTSSTAGNRLLCVSAADYTLSAGGSAVLLYDSTSGAWRVG